MAKLSRLLLLVIYYLILPFTWQKRFEPTWESLDTHVAPSWYAKSKVWNIHDVGFVFSTILWQ